MSTKYYNNLVDVSNTLEPTQFYQNIKNINKQYIQHINTIRSNYKCLFFDIQTHFILMSNIDDFDNSNELTPNAAYNQHMFTSSCCHAFNLYEGTSCICSQCGRVINRIKDDELLTISIRFNENIDANVSGDIIMNFREKAKRFATDPTYEICDQQCPKCKSFCRYCRDAQKEIMFICSNPDCRFVFSPNDKLLTKEG